MKYPYECCRCGFCCLSETCLIGQQVLGVGKYEACSALSFIGDEASCSLTTSCSAEILGIGEGCCIKARAYRGGIKYDFAAASPILKQASARKLRRKG